MNLKFLSKYEEEGYAILRIITGFLFLWHGSQKYFHFPPLPPGVVFPQYIVYIAGTIELFGGILVMLGLFTRWAAFLASGEMAYAYWMIHAHNGLLPLVNHGELAVLYCFVFLFIWSKGPGIWSIDHVRKRTIPVE
jgi:putative oxidoreductase